MAFLDNSGDIILDAVLTEAGRRRMANGTYPIVTGKQLYFDLLTIQYISNV